MPQKTKQTSQDFGLISRIELFDTREVRREHRNRRKPDFPIDEKFENKAWLLIHSLRPIRISIGKDPEIILPEKSFRPDVIAVFSNCILIIEAKYTEASSFIGEWISKYREVRRDLWPTLKKQFPELKFIVPILAVKAISSVEKRHKDELKNLRVKLIDERDLNYFQSIKDACGIGINHLFWGKVAPKVYCSENDPIPALCMHLGGRREAYIFAANPHDILCRSFVSHRELHAPEEGIVGYQRMLQSKKLNEIAEFILDGNTFPTPIVVAMKGDKRYFQQTGKELQRKTKSDKKRPIVFGYVQLPSEAGSIQIIDGQHRLFGYTKVEYDEEHIIQVVAYNQLEGSSPASMFVEINHEQTPVKSNLLWELYPDIYSREDSQYYLSIISKAVEKSIFDTIPDSVQHISRGTKGRITFQTLCNEIKKLNLVRKNMGGYLAVANPDPKEIERKLENLLNALFGAMIALGHGKEDVNFELLLTNNGIIPILRITGRIVKELMNDVGIFSKRQNMQDVIEAYLKPIYENFSAKSRADLGRMRKGATGNAGQNFLDDKMTELIRELKPDFPFRHKYDSDPEFNEIVTRVANKTDQINAIATLSGKLDESVFKEFISQMFVKSLRQPIVDERGLNQLLDVLYKNYYEGSGKDAPNNRVKQLLEIEDIKALPIIKDIDVLRTLFEHKEYQIKQIKRQAAIKVLEKLSGLENISALNDLQIDEYVLVSKTLLSRVISELLDPLINVLKPVRVGMG